MNFIEEYKRGQQGINKGIPMGDGLTSINEHINGVQKGRMYGIAAAPKVGKTTFSDYAFLLSPYLDSLESNNKIKWIYFSFEINRISKEFDFASFFLDHDYGINTIELPLGITKDSQSYIPISSDVLRGRVQDDNRNIIKVPSYILDKIKIIYEKRIIPLFGEYTPSGTKIKEGLIDFIEEKNNPTGLRNTLMHYADKNGRFVKEGGQYNNRISGYVSNDDSVHTIIITDHLRKLLPEKGYDTKKTVDKYIEYTVELRNWCNYTFVHIIHLNRAMSDMSRRKAYGDTIYPGPDDIKDTGNLSEEADYLFTMFNPNDDIHGLSTYFGVPIKRNRIPIYPNLRTVHLVESRYCSYPHHWSLNMIGSTKKFEKVKLKKNGN